MRKLLVLLALCAGSSFELVHAAAAPTDEQREQEMASLKASIDPDALRETGHALAGGSDEDQGEPCAGCDAASAAVESNHAEHGEPACEPLHKISRLRACCKALRSMGKLRLLSAGCFTLYALYQGAECWYPELAQSPIIPICLGLVVVCAPAVAAIRGELDEQLCATAGALTANLRGGLISKHS